MERPQKHSFMCHVEKYISWTRTAAWVEARSFNKKINKELEILQFSLESRWLNLYVFFAFRLLFNIVLNNQCFVCEK